MRHLLGTISVSILGGAVLMSDEKLTIVPVTLQPVSENEFSHATSNTSGICIIKTGATEISFYNGLEERIIQTVLRELKHL
jgi:hypothetical protein